MLKDMPLLNCPDCGAELLPPTRQLHGKNLALADVTDNLRPSEIPCPLCGQKKLQKDLTGVMRNSSRSPRRWRFTYSGIL